jgi:predicted porin
LENFYMKKTLIALAALAATGASFAQVTITGNLTAGFQQTTSNGYTGLTTQTAAARNNYATAILVSRGTTLAQAQLALQNGALDPASPNYQPALAAAVGPRSTVQNNASGFGVDTAEIFITAKEDIGGGQTIEAQLGLDNVSRGAAANFGAHDVKLTYTNTSFGRIQYGNTRGAAVFSGLPTAGAPVIDMDGKLFEERTQSEYINYAVPVGPITVLYQLGEDSSNGLGVGQSGAPSAVMQRSNTLLGLYRDGPLEAFLAYKTYDNGNGEFLVAPSGKVLSKDTQWSLQGAYDFGMAKVGFGYAYTRTNLGVTAADMLVGVNVPMGALEIGATWGQEIVSGIKGVPVTAFNLPNFQNQAWKDILSEAEGTATGWSIGAKYNLSKRTHFKVNHAAWTTSGYAQFENLATVGVSGFGNGPIETQTNVLLSHSF